MPFSAMIARTRSARGLLVGATLAAVGAAVLAPAASGSATSTPAPRSAPILDQSFREGVQMLRISAPDAGQIAWLSASADLLEARDGNDLFVLGDESEAARLRARGLRVSLERRLPSLPVAENGRDLSTVTQAAYPTFYGGYHTVAAHRQHLTDIAKKFPTLAKVVDYGDSWRKTKGLSGHDLQAVCITKRAAGDCALDPKAPKPRTLVMAGIHARELAPPEIAWNWIDYLTSNYGKVAAVTALLDSTEVWVLPMQNPDGRIIVESGGNSPYYQRKNANDTAGRSCAKPPTTSNQAGVDLNRNATFHWGQVGSSSSACSQTYRGTKAASEPETRALQQLFGKLFKDQRGPGAKDAAPASATGTMITYHSFAGLILYPWGDTNSPAPNGAKLKALATSMAKGNKYKVGQPGAILYSVSGTTDDDLYGRLGVASFTTELGAAGTSCDGFMPPYSCVASRFWPQERQALLALAKAAAGPYR